MSMHRVAPETLANGAVRDLVLSNDRRQKFVHMAVGANAEIFTLLRETGEVISRFGTPGRKTRQSKWVHNIAIDSRGTIYTVEVGTGRRAVREGRAGQVRGPRDPGDGRRDGRLGQVEAQPEARPDRDLQGGPVLRAAGRRSVLRGRNQAGTPGRQVTAGADPAARQPDRASGREVLHLRGAAGGGRYAATAHHSQRVEIRLSNGPMLHQWVWQGEKVAESEPGRVNWREPIVHEVRNIGDAPLGNFILEFMPQK